MLSLDPESLEGAVVKLVPLQSREAILRLGAVEEGVFRKHMVQADGSIRDSACFSIVDDVWPAVKTRLLSRLQRA